MAANLHPASMILIPYARVRHPRYGMGVIDDMDDSRITVSFDTGQEYTFTPARSELTRAFWSIGSLVLVRGKGVIGVVRGITSNRQLNQYRVELSITGDVVSLLEAGLSDANEDFGAVSDPLEGLRIRQFNHPHLFYARAMAQYLAASRQQLASSGATARIDTRPHQIFVARRVVSAPRPRFLLSDEVGLGKTIEAGLVIQELRARGSLQRVLIVVPANLTYQWHYELEQKFNERFAVYDSTAIRQVRQEHRAENPWLIERNIICSHGYIEQHEEEWEQIVGVPWDMVIVDEAHHARRRQGAGNRREATRLYQFVSRLSERTRGLLLLTATPMQLQTFELFSLIELLDCGLFHSYAYFEQQRSYNVTINALIKQLHEFAGLDQAQRLQLRNQLRAHLPTEQRSLTDRIATSALARHEIVDLLGEKHLLSEVMIRNRKRIIGDFTRRRPHIISVEFSEAERALYYAVSAYVRSAYHQIDQRRRGVVGFLLVAYQRRLTSSPHAFCKTIERRLAKLQAGQPTTAELPSWTEDDDLDDILGSADQVAFGEGRGAIELERRALQDLLAKARAIRGDTKFAAFLQFLGQLFRQNPREQVLIFTQFYDTLTYLQAQLERSWTVEVFHGAMRPKDKDTVIEQFRNGSARILISTEAGGEGRNLQFCAVLVNYDLPWNPMKIEQRIGRIDRIGQRRDVVICNFALRGTVEDRVLDLLARRIRIFEETVGGLDPILGELETDIQKIVLETPAEELDQALARRGEQLEIDIANARRVDEAQRDFVVDLRSFNQQAQIVFDDVERERLLQISQRWSLIMLKQLGASIETERDGSLIVRLGPKRGGILPQLRDRIFDITFDYQQALDTPRLDYGSFGHPLFDALIEYGTSDAFSRGYVAERTIKTDRHPGFIGFQFNFVVTEQSVYRSTSVVTIAVDDTGQVQPDVTDVLLTGTDWDGAVHSGNELSESEWEGRIEAAYLQAEDELQRIMQARMAARTQEAGPALDAEEQRINRYCDVRLRAAQEKLRHDREILNRLQQSSSADDRRVVPIWRRNVDNAAAYITTLEQERTRQLKELTQRRRVTYSYDLLNTARVVVVASEASAIVRAPSMPAMPSFQRGAFSERTPVAHTISPDDFSKKGRRAAGKRDAAPKESASVTTSFFQADSAAKTITGRTSKAEPGYTSLTIVGTVIQYVKGLFRKP